MARKKREIAPDDFEDELESLEQEMTESDEEDITPKPKLKLGSKSKTADETMKAEKIIANLESKGLLDDDVFINLLVLKLEEKEFDRKVGAALNRLGLIQE